MARLEVYQFSHDVVPEDDEFEIFEADMAQDGIPLEVSYFSGNVQITTVDHPENPSCGPTVGVFVKEDLNAWSVLSRFRDSTGNILEFTPTIDGEVTLNGIPIVVGGVRED
jgi:hypothetical protein